MKNNRNLAWRTFHYANYLLDRLVAMRVDPASTLIISGFRRSGTTWLQQSLAGILEAKTVFEPLNPAVPELARISPSLPIGHVSAESLELYMPYWPAEGKKNHRPPHGCFPKFIELALRGNLDSQSVRKVRLPNSSWKSRVVVKFIRSQLCFRAIHNHFGCPAIHVTRDPRAVIASLKMTDWCELVFGNLSLQQQLLEHPDGRMDFFDPWRTQIHKYDQEDMLIRAAAYWALSEKFIRHSFADQPPRTALVRYEDLVLQPGLINDVLDTLEVDYSRRRKFGSIREDSWTTVDQRRGISNEERIHGWRKILSAREIEMVGRVVEDFDLVDSLVNR